MAKGKTLEQIVKAALSSGDQLDTSKKDIIVKSKDRETAKENVEKALTKEKVTFSDVFKKSKSGSLNVLEVLGYGDIVFKPIIQKGAGGLKFEAELKVDLENYWNGVDIKKLKNKDVVKELENVVGISPDNKMKVLHEGKKNSKRVLEFNGSKLTATNSTGASLTDLTLEDDDTTYYLSLKMSKSYYVLNAAIDKFFKDKSTQVEMCEFFGMNGQKMGGFGKEYFCITKKPNYTNVTKALEEFMSQSYGTQVYVVHKKAPNDVVVTHVKKAPVKVMVKNLTEDSYIYPETGVRKYAGISFIANINRHDYKVQFQFRGTTASDVGPKYLRILMERL